MKKSLLSLLICIFSQFAFTQVNVLSPIQGKWANKQMLVIDTESNSEYFYSIDGSDPEKFGFAYDGPVLLDVTGDITVKIIQISNGKKQNATVDFTVELDNAYGTSYKNFIQTFFDSGIINYSAGSELSIPETLNFSLGLPPDSFIKGTTLLLDSNCVLQRTVPCVVFDSQKDIKYRFVVKIFPQSPGLYSQKKLPFSITDWNSISFNDKNCLYKVDSEYWSLPTKPRILDRSVSHMISWQNLDYVEGNPIEFFVLPPKPELQKNENDDGSFSYSIQGDESYTLAIKNQNTEEYSSLYKEIVVDCFEGERTSGIVEIGIFANGVYQGKIAETYRIDKRPPVIPSIKSNAKSFYSREKINIEITCEKDCELYIALSSPTNLVNLEKNSTPLGSESEILKNIKVGEFTKIDGNKFNVVWSQRGKSPAYYKVQAYSKSGKNTSEIIEYSAIVDQQNFYLDCTKNGIPTYETEIGEGTAENPFTSFEQCVKALQKNTIATIRVKGDVIIDKEYEIPSKLEFINDSECSFIFNDGASITLKGATVSLTNFIIKNSSDFNTEQVSPLFKAENSVLTLNNCMVDCTFPSNATIIESSNSIINISKTIASISSKDYASFISGYKSRISMNDSSVSINSATSVVISATKGNVNLQNNSLSVVGSSLRIAELFGVKADILNNRFTLRHLPPLAKNKKQNPIYINKATVLLEKDNELSEN